MCTLDFVLILTNFTFSCLVISACTTAVDGGNVGTAGDIYCLVSFFTSDLSSGRIVFSYEFLIGFLLQLSNACLAETGSASS